MVGTTPPQKRRLTRDVSMRKYRRRCCISRWFCREKEQFQLRGRRYLRAHLPTALFPQRENSDLYKHFLINGDFSDGGGGGGKCPKGDFFPIFQQKLIEKFVPFHNSIRGRKRIIILIITVRIYQPRDASCDKNSR